MLLRLDSTPRLAVELAGAGPAVVFLHGIGGNRLNWAAQVDAVQGDFTALAWDARGYGDSEDYEGPLDFADFSRDLHRVLDRVGVRRAHLVGLSMGGRIALDFYARSPERVASLTLADTSAGNAKVASPAEIDAFLAIRKRPLLEGKTPRDIAPEILATIIGPATGRDVQQQMFESLAALHQESYLKTLDSVTRYTAFPAFEDIAVPALVIAGEHDRIATPSHARSMAERIPGARLEIIAGGSHISNMDQPFGFNRVLLEFLRQHRTRADVPERAIENAPAAANRETRL